MIKGASLGAGEAAVVLMLSAGQALYEALPCRGSAPWKPPRREALASPQPATKEGAQGHSPDALEVTPGASAHFLSLGFSSPVVWRAKLGHRIRKILQLNLNLCVTTVELYGPEQVIQILSTSVVCKNEDDITSFPSFCEV